MAMRDDPSDESVEYGNATTVSNNKKATDLFTTLLFGAVYAHMLHLNTRSYAEHMALDALYSELPGLVDSLVESYQGKYGLVNDWPQLPDNCVAFVTGLNKMVEKLRDDVSDDSEIQNQIDEIASLLDSTTYKLKFLS